MAAKQQTKKPLAPMVAYEADREAKREALRTAMKQIERDFGEGAIMKLGENQHMAVQAVHTGSLSLPCISLPRCRRRAVTRLS